MKKSEIFNEILSVVCACSEISEAAVLCAENKTEEVSVARSAIVWLSNEYHLSAKQLQGFMHLRSHSSVYYHRNQFHALSESSRPFRFLLSSVRHELDKTMS